MNVIKVLRNVFKSHYIEEQLFNVMFEILTYGQINV